MTEGTLAAELEAMIAKTARSLHAARMHFETGDYAYLLRVSEQAAQEDIELAGEIVAKVESYLHAFLRPSG